MIAGQRIYSMCLASTISTITGRSLKKDSARIAKDPDGTASTRKGCILSDWSTLQISKKAALVFLDRNNSTGLKRMLKVYLPVLPSSSLHIFRCGLSTPSGGGERTM